MHTEDEKIPEACINDAATRLIEALGPETLKKVGGQRWWQWRTRPLQGEWIEMRSDYRHRRRNPEEKLKTMLYIHGGAYYFGSVDEHRYQMQRHARKLHARVFARTFTFCSFHTDMDIFFLICSSKYIYIFILEGARFPSSLFPHMPLMEYMEYIFTYLYIPIVSFPLCCELIWP